MGKLQRVVAVPVNPRPKMYTARYYQAPAPSKSLNRRGVASRETGYVDLAVANYALDTTGSIVLLATVPQGTSVQQRVGKKIFFPFPTASLLDNDERFFQQIL